MEGSLGRLPPTDWKHVEKYPLSAAIAAPIEDSILTIPTGRFERSLSLPSYWPEWNQDTGKPISTWAPWKSGACTGFGTSMMTSMTNQRQDVQHRLHRYEPYWLYHQAQYIDEWSGEDYEGSSVRAACDVLRTQGHIRIIRGKAQNPSIAEGIEANRWATDVDEIRAAIFNGLAVSIGINWYRNFDAPVTSNGELWIGRDSNWSHTGIRGGHCLCIYRMSDRRQAFRLVNSWGRNMPPVFMPYDTMQVLLNQDGEAVVITDR